MVLIKYGAVVFPQPPRQFVPGFSEMMCYEASLIFHFDGSGESFVPSFTFDVTWVEVNNLVISFQTHPSKVPSFSERNFASIFPYPSF